MASFWSVFEVSPYRLIYWQTNFHWNDFTKESPYRKEKKSEMLQSRSHWKLLKDCLKCKVSVFHRQKATLKILKQYKRSKRREVKILQIKVVFDKKAEMQLTSKYSWSWILISSLVWILSWNIWNWIYEWWSIVFESFGTWQVSSHNSLLCFFNLFWCFDCFCVTVGMIESWGVWSR